MPSIKNQCKKSWGSLSPIVESSARFCDSCNRHVFNVQGENGPDEEALSFHASLGNCVSYQIGEQRTLGQANASYRVAEKLDWGDTYKLLLSAPASPPLGFKGSIEKYFGYLSDEDAKRLLSQDGGVLAYDSEPEAMYAKKELEGVGFIVDMQTVKGTPLISKFQMVQLMDMFTTEPFFGLRLDIPSQPPSYMEKFGAPPPLQLGKFFADMALTFPEKAKKQSRLYKEKLAEQVRLNEPVKDWDKFAKPLLDPFRDRCWVPTFNSPD